MVFPELTAFYAGVLALLYAGIAGWVVGSRIAKDVLHGSGDDDVLLKRIRIHGNFAEYVPFALLLLALLEAGGGHRGLVHVLLILLLVARVLHPVGMLAPKNSPRQYICRGGGIVTTLAILVVAALALVLR